MSNKPERFPAIRLTMLPKDTNAYGTIFGGVILSYIDLAGGIEARRQSPKKFVTKAMREVVFVAPVHLGDLVTVLHADHPDRQNLDLRGRRSRSRKTRTAEEPRRSSE